MGVQVIFWTILYTLGSLLEFAFEVIFLHLNEVEEDYTKFLIQFNYYSQSNHGLLHPIKGIMQDMSSLPFVSKED